MPPEEFAQPSGCHAPFLRACSWWGGLQPAKSEHSSDSSPRGFQTFTTYAVHSEISLPKSHGRSRSMPDPWRGDAAKNSVRFPLRFGPRKTCVFLGGEDDDSFSAMLRDALRTALPGTAKDLAEAFFSLLKLPLHLNRVVFSQRRHSSARVAIGIFLSDHSSQIVAYADVLDWHLPDSKPACGYRSGASHPPRPFTWPAYSEPAVLARRCRHSSSMPCRRAPFVWRPPPRSTRTSPATNDPTHAARL